MFSWIFDRLRRRWLPLIAALLGALSATGGLRADSWQLPWPEHENYVPLRGLTNWLLPGVFNSAQIARGSLRNTLPEQALSQHLCGFDVSRTGDDRGVRLCIEVRGRPEQAVWVAFGADNIETNGILDGLECRLMVGLDRGRWGLRGNAMGAPVWVPAQLPPDGGICRIEVEIPAGDASVRAVVEDAGGRRVPEPFAAFDPEWHRLPGDAGEEWPLVRIETRGAQAELAGLSLRREQRGILMIR
jgi:hypothetical protein